MGTCRLCHDESAGEGICHEECLTEMSRRGELGMCILCGEREMLQEWTHDINWEWPRGGDSTRKAGNGAAVWDWCIDCCREWIRRGRNTRTMYRNYPGAGGRRDTVPALGVT